MKFFVAIFALVAAFNVEVSEGRSGVHHYFSQNVTDMISGYGYPVQNFTVLTTDGYYLDVIRIPGRPEEKSDFEQKQHQMRRDGVPTGKPAVILMHGLLSSAEDFVIGGPSEGLAFGLANSGYDVFMANARGNNYARKHTTLNPDKDAAFWKFCWSEIGTKDLPAIIDEVLKITEQREVFFVGHMQGTTAFYVMASERPEYNRKIKMMVSLGPVAFMKGATNSMLKTISENQESTAWIMKTIGMNEFHPTNEFMTTVGEQDCMARGINERICQNPYFLINGYESDHLNMTTMNRYAPRLPAGASTRQILHYGQLIKSGRFAKYSKDSSSSTEDYDLSKITVPMAIFWAPKDKISSEQDVQMLVSKLPNVVDNIEVSEITNNLDLLYAKHVKSNVCSKLLAALKSK